MDAITKREWSFGNTGAGYDKPESPMITARSAVKALGPEFSVRSAKYLGRGYLVYRGGVSVFESSEWEGIERWAHEVAYGASI